MTSTNTLLARSHGNMFLISPQTTRFPDKPLVLLLHGAFEKHKKLLPWSETWAAHYDVALADLPGHGQSAPPATISFDSYIEELRWLVGEHYAARRVVVVGDSFGGLLGIALGNAPPANLAGVVALDPLLSTAKQWSILDLLPRILDNQPPDGFRRLFASHIMGMSENPPENRDYAFYVVGARVPVMVLTGTEALGEKRDVAGPSLLDDADRAFLRRHVTLGVIPDVGHQLVLQRPAETFAAAEGFVRGLT